MYIQVEAEDFLKPEIEDLVTERNIFLSSPLRRFIVDSGKASENNFFSFY